jgi:hypothetical protein
MKNTRLGVELTKFLLLMALGMASLAVVFLRVHTDNYFVKGDRVEASYYSLAVFDNSGDILFSTSPLNDYYYNYQVKDHLQDKLSSSNNGGIREDLLQTLSSLFLNKRSLSWNTNGVNSIGKVSANYTASPTSAGLEITREIKFEKNAPASIGEAVKVCSDCLVADDKNRAYFNGNALTKSNIDLASRLNRTPLVLRSEQYFPSDASKILFIKPDGTVILEIPVAGAQVFWEEDWQLLVFKYPVKTNSRIVMKQDIYIK